MLDVRITRAGVDDFSSEPTTEILTPPKRVNHDSRPASHPRDGFGQAAISVPWVRVIDQPGVADGLPGTTLAILTVTWHGLLQTSNEAGTTMFGSGHLFGRRAGLREVGAPAELRHREFTVKPLARGPHDCPSILGRLSHWRTDGKTVVEYTCGERKWQIQFDYHAEIEVALKTAKSVARHWRSLMQAGQELPENPASSLPHGVITVRLGSSRLHGESAGS